jgi:hypothetical protein
MEFAVAGTFLDGHALYIVLHAFTRNYSSRPSVFGSLEFHHAEIVAFLPFSICFLAHVAKLSGSDMMRMSCPVGARCGPAESTFVVCLRVMSIITRGNP